MGFGQQGVAGLLAVAICGAVWASNAGITTSLLVTGLLALAFLDHYNRGYWERRGIPTVSWNLPIIGHATIFFRTDELVYDTWEKVYREHKDSKVCGMYFFWTPFAVVTDAEMTKTIAIKDFDHFVDRRPMASSGKDEYANDFLTVAEGSHWRGIRTALSPTFSSGKMKRMFPMVMKKADELYSKLHQELNKANNNTLDMLDYCGRFTVDVVASCAFGFEINALNNESVEFVEKLTKASNFDWRFILALFIRPVFPKLLDILDFSMWKGFRYHKKVLENSIQNRKATEELGVRGDFIDLILEAQIAQKETENKESRKDITDNTVIASSVIFLLAGFDTVKNTLVILLHHLAQHPTVQQNLRQEIQKIVQENGSLNYQSVMESKYLDAVISESQRNVPAIGAILERKCVKPYLIPGTDKKIDKDILVEIPVWSLHRDERYWNDPHTFNPDNFMPPNKQNIVQGSFAPFGLGPRNCIAQRFALMELKIVTARLVQDIKFSLAPGREELGLKKGVLFRPLDTMPLVLTPVREE